MSKLSRAERASRSAIVCNVLAGTTVIILALVMGWGVGGVLLGCGSLAFAAFQYWMDSRARKQGLLK
jgi:hypothetical protein